MGINPQGRSALLTEPRNQPQTRPAGPPAADFVRISANATAFPGDLAAAQAQFRRFQAIHLSHVFDPALLATTLRLSDSSTFTPSSAAGFREVEEPQRAGKMLNLLLSRPSFLRWLEQATAHEPLERIEGRLAQTVARPGDRLIWHDDDPGSARRLAIVINLSTKPFEGGDFEIRHKNGETLFAHRYTELNSALIFAVNHALEHRVLPLSSGGPRRVFAGWAFSPEDEAKP